MSLTYLVKVYPGPLRGCQRAMAGWSSNYPKSLVTQSAWGYPAPKQTRIISHKILVNWNPSVYYHIVTLSLTWLTSRLFYCTKSQTEVWSSLE